MAELVYCLGKGRKNKKLHTDPQRMHPVIGQDAYKCHTCGFTLTRIAIVKDAGLNEYWATGKDLGNTGTSQGTRYNNAIRATPISNTKYTFHYTQGTSTQSISSYANIWNNNPFSIKWTDDEPDLYNLPIEKRDEPIRAWRSAAKVEVKNGVVLFTGITGPKYTMDDRAICLYNPAGHHWTDIPIFRCTCGFHAMKPKWMLTDAERERWPILLEVELYGRVLEAKLGYRAQHQRILQVYGMVHDIPGLRVEDTKTALQKMYNQAKERDIK